MACYRRGQTCSNGGSVSVTLPWDHWFSCWIYLGEEDLPWWLKQSHVTLKPKDDYFLASSPGGGVSKSALCWLSVICFLLEGSLV